MGQTAPKLALHHVNYIILGYATLRFIILSNLVCLQFLESYKSVTLQSMADAFGISVEFMDEEVAEFIVDGRLPAKIDKVAGVIETKR